MLSLLASTGHHEAWHWLFAQQNSAWVCVTWLGRFVWQPGPVFSRNRIRDWIYARQNRIKYSAWILVSVQLLLACLRPLGDRVSQHPFTLMEESAVLINVALAFIMTQSGRHFRTNKEKLDKPNNPNWSCYYLHSKCVDNACLALICFVFTGTENKRSSIWQLCRHWRHRKLS